MNLYRKNIQSIIILIILLSFLAVDAFAQSNRVVAYVTSWSDEMPNPYYMTNLNYAFGHVNDTFNGVRIDNPSRLHKIAGLKDLNPYLQVQLSIGGWGSGRFSEMAADAALRAAFVAECRREKRKFPLHCL